MSFCGMNAIMLGGCPIYTERFLSWFTVVCRRCAFASANKLLTFSIIKMNPTMRGDIAVSANWQKESPAIFQRQSAFRISSWIWSKALLVGAKTAETQWMQRFQLWSRFHADPRSTISWFWRVTNSRFLVLILSRQLCENKFACHTVWAKEIKS